MNVIKNALIATAFGCAIISCKNDPSVDQKVPSDPADAQKPISEVLEQRYEYLLDYPVDSMAFPRSYNPDSAQIKKVPSKDWTSGFFAGNLWQLYELSGESRFRESALKWTRFIEKEKLNGGTHDMGFKVYNSFGLGLQNNGDADYKDVIVKSAKTLSTRFNENVQSIRSWDFRIKQWEFPVIIDNMMNLELLFEATKLSQDSSFHKIAVTHANTTLKNHFRPDHSTYHVVVYDTINGQVKDKVTHQGYGKETSWARGQGWAIYGYTMAYRYTKDQRYLEQAKNTASFYLNHKNLPDDGIPYWDFDAPNIPDEPRDVSAAAIVGSALVELYEYTNDQTYLDYSYKVLNTLETEEYVLPADLKIPFILDHSSGDWSKRAEMDEPIIYGDYYYLELKRRLQALNNS
ncbi:MAG: glycoside hydrolase family 88 protein [Nonlabens sp.]